MSLLLKLMLMRQMLLHGRNFAKIVLIGCCVEAKGDASVVLPRTPASGAGIAFQRRQWLLLLLLLLLSLLMLLLSQGIDKSGSHGRRVGVRMGRSEGEMRHGGNRMMQALIL